MHMWWDHQVIIPLKFLKQNEKLNAHLEDQQL